MELVDYLGLLRRRAAWLVAGALVGLAVGLLAVLLTPRTYTATSELFVGNAVSGGTAETSTAAQSASQYTLSRMPSYAALLSAPGLAAQVAASLPFRMSGLALEQGVQVTNPPKTLLLDVQAQDADRGRAADIANAAADRLRSSIEVLEVPSSGGPPPVKVSVISLATPPTSPSSPSKSLDLGFGVVLGLGFGFLAAVAKDASWRRDQASSRLVPGASAAVPVEQVPVEQHSAVPARHKEDLVKGRAKETQVDAPSG